jgi:hypothetical protein
LGESIGPVVTDRFASLERWRTGCGRVKGRLRLVDMSAATYATWSVGPVVLENAAGEYRLIVIDGSWDGEQ